MKKQAPAFKRTAVARSVLLVLSATSTMALVQPASAQNAPALQRVEVTGSNIRRAQTETASAVQTLTREDIEKSGKSSIAELLQTLSVDNQGSVPTTFGNGFASGASGISLRGLGAASTLVLINGRRIAPFGKADDGQKVFADLNVIPMEAVERVEILKDGASAIYGSDAIAGVVNIILRKDFKGTIIKAGTGQSSYGDGSDSRVTITHGFGDLENDKYNVLLNFEASKKGAIWNSDRTGRGQVGRGDGRDIGFDVDHAPTQAAGLAGYITSGGKAASSSVLGNVRNPTTLDYYSRGNPAGVGFTRTFPGANCANYTAISQAGGGGGCVIDAGRDYVQVQPKEQSLNFFARGTRQINPDLQAYAELNLFSNESDTSSTPSGVHGSVGYPGGPVSNAAVALGAAHPDNPYFGTAARLRYLAADVGPRRSHNTSDFLRLVAGLKGTYKEWDYDTALLFSQSKGDDERTGYLLRNTTFALLNPTAANVAAARTNAAYAALPAGTYWRLGENAGLNSAAVYAALSPTLYGSSVTKTTQLDFKASREVGKLEGGPIGLALGAELRRESINLDPTTGTDAGNVIGLGYSAYNGNRNVVAAYAEVLLPVKKNIEITAALRADHYSDVGDSFTPKLGVKWTPAKNLALRGTVAEGFRAPSAAENGVGGLAAFSSASDPVRCAVGVASACSPGSVALITSPNPGLKPETSQSYSLGVVWDPTPKTSMSLDFWQIVRKNEINQGITSAAIAAGNVSRDPSTSIMAGDPGAITAVLVGYVNSAQTTVRGLDFDVKHRMDLPDGYGKVTLQAGWTHLFTWERKEQDGTTYDFAGTHGNCDTSNCMGTPADRVNLSATWERGAWRVAGLVNYRGSLDNVAFKNDPAGCYTTHADGTDAPIGCKVASFTTLDVNFRYKYSEKTEIYGGIRNLLNRNAPFDPTTYGAVGYNPIDYSGAVGRFFSIGMRHKF